MKILFALAALSGCSCTMMYAPSTVTVEVLADDWAPGTYELEASGYTSFAMCVVTLPFEEGDLVHCTGNADVALSEQGDAIVGMTLWHFTPPSFGIDVFRDGEPVGEPQGFTPEYEVDEPNGRGCGERSLASVTLDLRP